MPRLLSSKAHEHKYLRKTAKPCHVGINWIALVEKSQISIHVPGFQSLFRFFAKEAKRRYVVLRRFQQFRSYRDEIETRNLEEIPFSSRIVTRGPSVFLYGFVMAKNTTVAYGLRYF